MKKIDRRTFLKAMGAAALMGAAGCLTGCGSLGDDGEKSTIIRVAFNQPETHAEYIALADFGEKFAAATNGRYQVEIYPNAVLGDQGPVTEMIRTGALQLAVVPISVPESYNSDFAIIAAPYLYDDLEQMETAAREGVFDPLFATTGKFNFEVATLYTSGARHIYTDKPIVTPEDLKGYKIRVQDSDTYLRMIEQIAVIGVDNIRPDMRSHPDCKGSEVLEDALDSSDVLFYDVLFYKERSDVHEIMLPMTDGCCAVFFPEDVHRPCCMIDAPEDVKKIVLKVRVDSL